MKTKSHALFTGLAIVFLAGCAAPVLRIPQGGFQQPTLAFCMQEDAMRSESPEEKARDEEWRRECYKAYLVTCQDQCFEKSKDSVTGKNGEAQDLAQLMENTTEAQYAAPFCLMRQKELEAEQAQGKKNEAGQIEWLKHCLAIPGVQTSATIGAQLSDKLANLYLNANEACSKAEPLAVQDFTRKRLAKCLVQERYQNMSQTVQSWKTSPRCNAKDLEEYRNAFMTIDFLGELRNLILQIDSSCLSQTLEIPQRQEYIAILIDWSRSLADSTKSSVQASLLKNYAWGLHLNQIKLHRELGHADTVEALIYKWAFGRLLETKAGDSLYLQIMQEMNIPWDPFEITARHLQSLPVSPEPDSLATLQLLKELDMYSLTKTPAHAEHFSAAILAFATEKKLDKKAIRTKISHLIKILDEQSQFYGKAFKKSRPQAYTALAQHLKEMSAHLNQISK